MVYREDNKGANSCLETMKGQPETLQEVEKVYEMSERYDVHLEFQWLPRTDAVISIADSLSCVVDDATNSHL